MKPLWVSTLSGRGSGLVHSMNGKSMCFCFVMLESESGAFKSLRLPSRSGFFLIRSFFIQLDRFFWILTASQCVIFTCFSFLTLCLEQFSMVVPALLSNIFLLPFPGYLGLQDAPTYKCLFCLFVFIFNVLETNKHRFTKEKYSQEMQKFQGRNTHKCYFF